MCLNLQQTETRTRGVSKNHLLSVTYAHTHAHYLKTKNWANWDTLCIYRQYIYTYVTYIQIKLLRLGEFGCSRSVQLYERFQCLRHLTSVEKPVGFNRASRHAFQAKFCLGLQDYLSNTYKFHKIICGPHFLKTFYL